MFLGEWKHRFLALGDEKDKFISYIGDNNFSVERYLEIQEPELKKLFIHYFTMPTLLKALLITDNDDKEIIVNYITKDFPLIYDRMIRYVVGGKLPYSLLEGAFRTFGAQFVSSVLEKINYSQNEEPFVINNLIKVQRKVRMNVFKFEYIQSFYIYKSVGALDKKTTKVLVEAIKNLDEGRTKKILEEKFEKFKEKLISQATEKEAGAAYIAEQIDNQLNNFCKQLSLFEDWE